MPNDMSMFKKMKERITDEVNSATNKLQNMQIIDQLTTTIGQQIKGEPNQLLITPHDSSSNPITKMPRNSQFSLINDGPISGYNEDEELNSEISPQHQLFNEHSIKRLDPKQSLESPKAGKNGMISNQQISKSARIQLIEDSHGVSDKQSVINVEELNSDLEDGTYDEPDSESRDSLDKEIDLLSDTPTLSNSATISTDKKFDGGPSSSCPPSRYKTRYRTLVHAIRRLNRDFESEKGKLESQRQNLESQVTTLKTELDYLKRQHNRHESLNMNGSEKSAGSPQPTTKASTKIRDLEKLLAKCKESLKSKNSQILALKDSLSEVEKFKNFNQDLRRDLAELREAHETWTVSIAENKRVMHQEMENKNAEVEQAKAEANELQHRLSDSNTKTRQLKSAIQDLENRLVSTSAAHQKERESLTKELTLAKNTAIRQLQKEHEHNLERVKLDLERSIESLKLEMLKKDEQIVNGVTKQKKMQEDNQKIAAELVASNKKFEEQLGMLNESRTNHDQIVKRCSDLEAELNSLKNQFSQSEDLNSRNEKLANEFESLNEKLSSAETAQSEIEKHLLDSKSFTKHCDCCENLDKDMSLKAEKFQQELHVMTTRLDLMTTANDDQEKEIKFLKSERDSLGEHAKILKSEIEELLKKNDTLSRVVQENETDMQAQQDQLDGLTSVKQELDLLKKENSLLSENLNQLKNELDEKNSELTESKTRNEELASQITDLRTELASNYKLSEELKKEKESLIANNESSQKRKRELDEHLVVRILTAMKNLDTPNTSPGSDKSYESLRHEAVNDGDDKPLPELTVLMDELASLALDRSNAYASASQRLQAVLLDNTMMGEELRRLKEELNQLNREKTLESQSSIEETDKLHRENQALIHDQQSYEDRLKTFEDELATLTSQLEEREIELSQAKQLALEAQRVEELESDCKVKQDELFVLRKILAEKEVLERNHSIDLEDNLLVLESYRQKNEDLDDKLNQVESDCQSKDRQLALLTDELKHFKENVNLNPATPSQNPDDRNMEAGNSDKATIESLEAEKVALLKKVSDLQEELTANSQPESTGDQSYQLRALQRILQQYQEENRRLKETQKNLTAQISKGDEAAYIPDSTEFEYLKNIVYQFMLGKEPLVLARVISAVFKFDKSQVEQICKVQEAVQSSLKQSI